METMGWIVAGLILMVAFIVITIRIEFNRYVRDGWCCRYCGGMNSKNDDFCPNCGEYRCTYE